MIMQINKILLVSDHVYKYLECRICLKKQLTLYLQPLNNIYFNCAFNTMNQNKLNASTCFLPCLGM